MKERVNGVKELLRWVDLALKLSMRERVGEEFARGGDTRI